MSVYLYLQCKDCQEFTDVIGRNTDREEWPNGWRIYYGDEKVNKEIAEFLTKHYSHNVSLVNEGTRYPESPPWQPERDEYAQSS